MTSLKHNLKIFFQGISFFFAGRMLGEGLNYFTFVLIARWYGINIAGIFFLSLSILNVLSMVARFGMDGSIVKYVSEFLCKRNKNRVRIILSTSLATVLCISIILLVLWYLFFPYIKPYLSSTNNSLFISIMILALPFFSMASILVSATRGMKNVKYHIFLMFIVFPVSFLAILSVCRLLKYSEISPFISYFLSTIILFGASFLVVKRLFKLRLNIPRIRSNLSRSILSYSLPLLISGLLNLLLVRTDLFFIAYFFDNTMLGIYSSGIKTAVMISFFLMTTNFVMAPIFSELYVLKQIVEMKQIFQIINKWIVFLSLIGMLFLIFFLDVVLSIFQIPSDESSIIFIALGFSQFFNAISGPVGTILVMTQSQRFLMKNDLFFYFLHIIFLPLFIQWLGPVGAAAATCLSIFFVNVSRSVKVYRTLAVHTFNRHTVRLFLMGIAVLALSAWFRFQHPTGFSLVEALVSFSVIGVFLMVFFTVFCFQSEDKELVNWILRRSNNQ